MFDYKLEIEKQVAHGKANLANNSFKNREDLAPFPASHNVLFVHIKGGGLSQYSLIKLFRFGIQHLMECVQKKYNVK